MSWRYKQLINSYGKEQVFDCSVAPHKPVCQECHCEYINGIDELSCPTCRDSRDAPEETGQTTEQITNEFGFTDFILLFNGEIQRYDSGKPITVCPQCMAMVMPNRGSGCLCGQCDHEFMVECQHNYDTFHVF